MGISMAGSDAFSYNRFDALNEAYRSLYEEKEEKDEDDEKGMNPFAKKKHEKGESEEEESEEDDDEKEESDDDDDDDEKEESDDEKSDKKFPSFLKKSKGDKVEEAVTDKGNRLIDAYDRAPYSDDPDKRDPKKMKIKGKLPKGTVKEEVIEYLMDNGFVNNEVSAEVMAEHMNPEWMEAILEEVEGCSKKSTKGHSLLADLFGEPKTKKKEDKNDERSANTEKSVKEETTKFDERGRPKSGPYSVYQKGNSKPNASFDAARKRVDAANRAKSPEQRKAELDAYKERQANR